MDRTPLVSIVIPTYNRAGLIENAVESALAQTYRRKEVVVVDDGSTDGTCASLRRYGAAIRVIEQENGGPAIARNTGITHSNGDVIAFLDSDDTWLPNKVERQMVALTKAGPSVPCCLTNTTLKYADGRTTTSFRLSLMEAPAADGIWTNPVDVLSTRFVLFNQAVAVRRPVLERIGGFRAGYAPLEDYEFSLRLSLEGPFAYVRDPLVVWNGGSPGSLSAAIRQREVANLLASIREDLLEEMQKRGTPRATQLLMDGELKRTRRELMALQLRLTGSWTASKAGLLLSYTERYRHALFRRSPWFPRMATSPFGGPLAAVEW